MQTKQALTARFLAMMMLLTGLEPAGALTTILSTVPTNGANNVSPGAPVVFTFSAAMNSTSTVAAFYDVNADLESPPVSPVWSAGNTVLTCTPWPAFANNHVIQWQVAGQDTLGNPLSGATTGSFTNVVGVNGGSGTNAFTFFQVVHYTFYVQTSASPPVLLPNITYEFFAQTLLSSNRTATNITVTIPVRLAVSNLVENLLSPERFSVSDFSTNLLETFTTNFPSGNYIFNVSAVDSNQQVTVNLPAYVPPNSPQVSNYVAAQSVNPSQPFTLNWITFTNGLSTDWILFQIEGGPIGTLFQTGDPGQPGALNGTSTSVIIPANTLSADSTNTAVLAFYHVAASTNGTTVTQASVASVTYFSIITTTNVAVASAPVLTIRPSGTNVILTWPTNATGFTLESATNLVSPVWTTNSTAPFIVNTNNAVTNGISGTQKFYRLSQ
ncbi:MAG: Ig-like domain-containing protein [Verrucomicrobiia bacterium]